MPFAALHRWMLSPLNEHVDKTCFEYRVRPAACFCCSCRWLLITRQARLYVWPCNDPMMRRCLWHGFCLSRCCCLCCCYLHHWTLRLWTSPEICARNPRWSYNARHPSAARRTLEKLLSVYQCWRASAARVSARKQKQITDRMASYISQIVTITSAHLVRALSRSRVIPLLEWQTKATRVINMQSVCVRSLFAVALANWTYSGGNWHFIDICNLFAQQQCVFFNDQL